MKPKIYLLVFDPYKTNATALHGIISSATPLVKEWWHYIGSAYVFTSDNTALELQTYLNSKWGGNYLLTEINAHNSGGWLPREAWNWINGYRR